MKKLIALLFIVFITNANAQSLLLPATDSYSVLNQKSLNNISYYNEDFETEYQSGTNGLNSNLEINSIYTEPEYQWKREYDANSWFGTYCARVDYIAGLTERDEDLITPQISLGSDSVRLNFSFYGSYYWMVDNDVSNLEVSISNDNGNTWNQLWISNNQTLVENSGMPWPYNNFEFYDVYIDISEYINQDIKIKFNYKSSLGNTSDIPSLNIDNIKVATVNDYDAKISDSFVSSSDSGFYYTMQPISEIRDANTFFGHIKNVGLNELTGVVFKNDLVDSQNNIIATKDTNSFINGDNTLSINDTNSFICHNMNVSNIITTPGLYNFNQSVNMNETDGSIYDNSISSNFEINNTNMLARCHYTNCTFTPSYFTDYITGDEVGYIFTVKNAHDIAGVLVPISAISDINGTFKVKLYKKPTPNDDPVLIETSGDYVVESNMLGNDVFVELLSAVTVIPGEIYYITVATWGDSQNQDEVVMDSYKCISNNVDLMNYYNEINKNTVVVYLQNESTWYYSYYILNLKIVLDDVVLATTIDSIQPICANTDIELNASTNISQATYSWSFAGGTPATSTLQSPTVNFTSGTHSCQLITNFQSYSDTTNFTVNVFDELFYNTDTISTNDGICNGEIDIAVSGGSGNYIFNWENILSNNDTVFNLCPGEYYLTLDAGCIVKDTFVINDTYYQTQIVADTFYAFVDTCVFDETIPLDSAYISNATIVGDSVYIDYVIWQAGINYNIDSVAYEYDSLDTYMYILSINCSNKSYNNWSIYSVIDLYDFTTQVNTEIRAIVLNIYPNPTTGLITVNAENIQQITVININGKQLLTTTNSTFNLGTYPKGIYFVKVTTQNGVMVKKVILE